MRQVVYEHDDVLIDIAERQWGVRCHAVLTTENEFAVGVHGSVRSVCVTLSCAYWAMRCMVNDIVQGHTLSSHDAGCAASSTGVKMTSIFLYFVQWPLRN